MSQLSEVDIFKICQDIIGANTNGQVSIVQSYKSILNLKNYPERLAQLIQILNQEAALDLTCYITENKTPAGTVMLLDILC